MNKRIKLKKAKQKNEKLERMLAHSRSVSNRLSDEKQELLRIIKVKDEQIRDIHFKMRNNPVLTSLHMSDNRTGIRTDDHFSQVETLRREFEVGPLRIRHDGPMTVNDLDRLAKQMCAKVHDEFMRIGFRLVDCDGGQHGRFR